MIPVEKYSIRSAQNVEYIYETVEHVHPVTKQSTGGPLLYYFNGSGKFFIISTGGPHLYYFNRWGCGAPSILFQRVGPFFIISTGSWGPVFIISTAGGLLFYYFNGWAPSSLFQRVGPFLLFAPP